MNKESQSPRRLGTDAAGAALTALVGLLFVPWLLGRGLAGLSFDLPFQWRANQPVDGAILIYMDEDSARALSQPWGGAAAWDRGQHARLLKRLTQCHAKAVVFDVLFNQNSTNDQSFVQAVQAAGPAGTKVVLGAELKVSALGGGSVLTKVFTPIPELEKFADWGLAELEPHRRHFPGEEGFPSLALRTAELTVPKRTEHLPAERWINFYGPAGFLTNRNYSQALDVDSTPADTFSNKVCFVGAAPGTPFPGGRRDEWETPYSRGGRNLTPGTEITATVYLNLARGDWLTRLPVWAEASIVALAGVLLGLGLAFCRPTAAALAGFAGSVAVAAGASWLMWRHHVWFSWLVIAGVQIPVAIICSALAYTRRLNREKLSLELKLANQPTTADPTVTTVVAPRPEASVSTVLEAEMPPARAADWTPPVPDHVMLRCVARGAYGEVWLARNAIGTYHAVKIVRRDRFDHADPYEREFRGLQRFMPISRSHPGLVAILQVGRRDAEGFIYYVMEAADDETTAERISPDTYSPRTLAKEIRRRGHLAAAECQKMGLDLTAALEFLHQQQLIHRDIKPANIIFVKGVPKFADIGLVTDIAGTGGASFLGTKGYIAPEGPGTPSADLYSLGKVLYEMSTGLGCELFPELPSTLFQRSDHLEMLSLNAVILQACRQDPSQRYQSAAEMREALLRCRAQGSA